MIFKRNYFLLDLFHVKSNSMSYSRSMLRCPKLYTRDHPLFMPTYSCRTDSCRLIHADPYSCPVGLIHARTYSCPHWFMPCKTKTCISRPFHAWFFSCQVNSCLLKDLFMPGFLMPIPIHASTKPQYCQTTKPNSIRFQGSVRLSEVGLG